MPKKVFQPSEFREDALQAIRDGASEMEILSRFPISQRTARRYAQEIEKEKTLGPDLKKGTVVSSAGPGAETGGGQKQVRGPQQLAVVTSRAPGPIVFRMGELNIDLEPQSIYDAFRYCEDIKRIDPSINDSFSQMLKIACKHTWEIFSEREARRVGTKIEITV